jgi:hypothetical protein
MKKVFVFFIALVFLTPNLFTQNYADVSANYRDTAYMDTLNGRKIQFPQQFLDSIKKFDVKSYRQSFPSSGVSALRSWIIFTCPIEKAEELATYLQTYETSLFTEIHYYMPPSTQSPKFEFNPIDYYWNKSRVIYPLYTIMFRTRWIICGILKKYKLI